MTALPLIDGLSAIVDRYDGFILDLWGVIHDGVRPYPGVVHCLTELRNRGKRVCLLSNAPRRVPAAVAKLNDMGVDVDLYDAIFTSGEATYEALLDPPDEWHQGLGRNLFHIGPPRDNDVYETLPNRRRVHTPDQADFVLNTGIDDFDETLADYEPVLTACVERRLPMLCANPDLVVVVDNKLVICAGELARRYEDLGGEVRYHGKPHAPVYRRCFQLLGDLSPSRILAVGDSLRTDIAGANEAGIDGLLVTGGIHREELGTNWGSHPDPQSLGRLVETSGHRPVAAIPGLRW
ncbi:TIGR01459 family HAD-type hydrolase [Niveispirillum sp. BGYR6]|uniref:TIGR01459 family HAD-type hydrolase n=1 Tax=Niveispirillum sp. BGYR6 TaxID=2971249 RepID=UPI0022B98243|nr:TIGR01459 family HAD-type hydrolase [Niveispirillum sp. BGYR6]MDG5495969.1 TIGR01459 family HAD-type hydrolase [Niveispirillum sp. BGYR6]